GVGAVALEAAVGEDRPHVAVVADLGRRAGLLRAQQRGQGDERQTGQRWGRALAHGVDAVSLPDGVRIIDGPGRTVHARAGDAAVRGVPPVWPPFVPPGWRPRTRARSVPAAPAVRSARVPGLSATRTPNMPRTRISVLLFLLPWGSAYAQGAVSAVPPGREV